MVLNPHIKFHGQRHVIYISSLRVELPNFAKDSASYQK